MTLRTAFLAPILAAAALTAVAPAALAEHPGVYSRGGVAIGGYDVVVYFREARAARGSMDHALMWRGATWLFVSDETMEAFEMNPKEFAPQYGGYCALAAAQGQAAPSDPETFSIIGGKLYLNNSAAARDRWLGDPEANISAANRNWAALSGQ